MRIQFGVLTVIISSTLVAGCYNFNPTQFVGFDGAASNDAPATQGGDVAQLDVPMGGAGGGGTSGGGGSIGGASGSVGGSGGDSGMPDAPGVQPDVPMGGSIGGTGGIGGIGGTGGGGGETTAIGGTTAVGGTGGGTTGVGGTPAGGGAGGGTAGTGPTAGTGGVTQSGGTMGTGGSGGTGGTAGTGGSSGTGGNTQPSLNCSAAVTPASGYVTDFSDYNPTTGKWGNTAGLYGGLFSCSGYEFSIPSAKIAAVVDPANQNLHVTGTLTSADYGGFGGVGLSFNVCTTVASFSSISFTLAGSAPGCFLNLMLQTYDQLSTTSNPPGGCVPSKPCGGFPGTGLATPSTTPTVVTTPFGAFSSWSAATAAQVVGILFLFSVSRVADGGTASCTVDVTIDDVKFVP
jgi:hypothetical protein